MNPMRIRDRLLISCSWTQRRPSNSTSNTSSAFGGITCFELERDGTVHAEPLTLSGSTLHELEDHLLLFFTGYSRSASAILKDQDTRTKSSDVQVPMLESSPFHGAFRARFDLYLQAEYAPGGGMVFAVQAVDETLAQRCEILDIHPTGPLWGKGVSAAQGAVATLESVVAVEQSLLANGLERAGLDAERRALRLPVSNLQWSLAEDRLTLAFRLSRGAFATAVLHELLDNAFAAGGLGEQEEE